MGTPGYLEQLISHDPRSELWWDSSPVLYAPHKHRLLDKYPTVAAYIERLMPDDWCQSRSFSSVTTNPRLVTAVILDRREYEASRVDQSNLSPEALHKKLYDEVIIDGASALKTLWEQSSHAEGWMCAQVEPSDVRCAQRMTARGMELHHLAPNVMVKVPGSQEGLASVEHLVARGVSINITFCFTVSQFQAGLQAIERGRLSARSHGIDTRHCKYVITYMIGRFGCQPEFAQQAAARSMALAPQELRWAELLIYEQIQALVAASRVPVHTLLSSLKIDVDARGDQHCWHLERTGLSATYYTLTPEMVAFLVERESRGQPVLPAHAPLQVPPATFAKLMRIPYFYQAYLLDSIAPQDFARHAAFVTACNEANAAHRRLTDHCVRLCAAAQHSRRSINEILATEYGSVA